MTVLSRVTWALGQRRGSLLRSPAPDRDADSALRSHLGWAAPAGAAFATLTAAAGAALGDRPTVLGAVVLMGALAILPLLFRSFATRILARLEAAVTERGAFQAELDAAHGAMEELLA